MNVCSTCGRKYKYSRKSGHRGTQCNSCVVNKYKSLIKEKAVALKGGKCVKCGYSKSKAALHFHHRDGSTKKFQIGSGHCYSWERIKLELDKCDLLCANCHAEVHTPP